MLRAVRRLLHAAHAAAALALLATGVLLGAPDLRAWLLGGYGREVAAWHDVGAWAFLAAPGAAVLLAARPLARDTRTRLVPPDGVAWRTVHLALALALSAALAASGLVLWAGERAPVPLYDAALWLHVGASWALGAALAVHLVAVRRRLVARVRELLGGAPDPALFDPYLESDD